MDKSKICVVSPDRYVVYDTVKMNITKELKHKKKDSSPTFLDVTSDDKYSIEVHHADPNTVLFRNLVSSNVQAKFEGHS